MKRFLGRGYEGEDLFQIGCIGMLKAIDRFDLSLNLSFSTYAVPLITGEIRRFLRDDGIIKISRTIKENQNKILLEKGQIEEKENREPTIEDVYKRQDVYNNLGVAYARLFEYEQAAAAFRSAYRLNKTNESLESIIMCDLITDNDKRLKIDQNKYSVTDTVVNRLRSELIKMKVEIQSDWDKDCLLYTSVLKLIKKI